MTARTFASAVAAASLAGVAVLGTAAPAAAQVYPPDQPAAISDSTVVPGQTVTVNSGAGTFEERTQVTVTVAGTTVATGTADADGNVEVTFDMPELSPGRYDVVFAAGDGTQVGVPFTVVAAAAANPGRGQGQDRQAGLVLPRTGTDQLVPLTATGVALVAVGGGIVVAARRRRESAPTSLS